MFGFGPWWGSCIATAIAGAAPAAHWTTANARWAISGTNNNVAAYTESSNGAQVVLANNASSSANYSVTINSTGGNEFAIGLANASVNITFPTQFDANAVGWDIFGGHAYVGGVDQGSIGTATVGDVIKIVNAAGHVSFYKNGTLLVTYDATGVGTSLYPMMDANPNSSATAQATADFTNWI